MSVRRVPPALHVVALNALRCRGALMLEALVGALVFAVAAIAIVGFQARAARTLGDAQFRVEAQQLAHAALGRMQSADNATLYEQFDMRAGGAGYRGVVVQAARLPGVSASRNAPRVLIRDGPSSVSRTASVAVQWQMPGDPDVHLYAATGVVGGR